MARAKTLSIFDLAAGMAFAAPHVAITLASRWPLLMAGRAPSAATRREMARMVLEKASAAVAGAAEGQKVALRLSADALAGKLKSTDMATAPATIAVASLKPALRTVRSNSKRLSRRRVSGRSARRR
jgi:hypothetical protein